ncbi:MAG TPA: hypothetical protein VIB82_07070 [Caulobacteraceae bacterium]|jgi:hypothetical protein
MARFMAIYTGDSSAGRAPPDQQMIAAGMAAWQDWGKRYADQIVEFGGPLGKTKRVNAGGVSDASNNLAAYVIVEADSHEAAARMFEGHPHFTIFPGDGVDVMPCLPVPGA